MALNKDEISRLTMEYGGAWGLQHTHRLLELISLIGEGSGYDGDAIWAAAHLHDWGAYPAWAQENVEHSLRSRQVAEIFLAEQGVSAEQQALILECIELHHTPGAERSLESILLRDADALDFLGVVGILRNFAMNPRDLRKGFEETRRRKEKMLGLLSLPASKAIAAERVRVMDRFLAQFEIESLGLF